jgi:hypothetical protein
MAATDTKHVDMLDEDYIPCGDLKYALLSFVAPGGRQRLEAGDRIGVKIRGAFATREEANAHVKRLMKTDNNFDIYIVDMFKWILLPPPNPDVIDTEYGNGYLNDMMTEYKKSQTEAKQHFEERKRLAMENGIDSVLTDEERLPKPPGVGGLISEENVHPVE